MFLCSSINNWKDIQSLSGKSSAIVNTMRAICATSMDPGSQGEWTGMRMCEQWQLHYTSQWGPLDAIVSMCTVWLSHSKWLSEWSNESASTFVLSLNIPLWTLFGWFRRPQLWATGDWSFIATMCLLMYHSDDSNHPGDSASLQPRFGALQLLDFLKTKIAYEREEISDCQWDSGKYNRAVDGDSNKGFYGVFWTMGEMPGELCEVPRCLLWRRLRHYCPMYNVSCILYLLQ